MVADYTIWTSAIDLRAKRYLLPHLREQPDPDGGSDEDESHGKDIVTISMKGDERIRPINP